MLSFEDLIIDMWFDGILNEDQKNLILDAYFSLYPNSPIMVQPLIEDASPDVAPND